MMDKQLQLRAILLGGIFAGVLSSIPGLGMAVNCCCCGGFYVIGGLMASYYIVSRTRTYPSDADAAIAGLGVGVLAGTISGTVNAITQLLTDPTKVVKDMEPFMQFIPPQYQDLMRQSLEQSAAAPRAPGIIFSMIMIVALAAGAGALSVFLGVRLLRPLRSMAPLAPPPAWGQWQQPYPAGYYPQPQAPAGYYPAQPQAAPPPYPAAYPAAPPPAAPPGAPPYAPPSPPAAPAAPAAPAWTPGPALGPRPAEGEAKPWGTEPTPPKSEDEGDQGPS